MTAGPVGRMARELGQGLIAAAISGVVRAIGVLAVIPATARELGSGTGKTRQDSYGKVG